MDNEQQKLDQIADTLKLNKVKEDIDNIHHELIDNYNRPKIPEALFVNYFLPFMTGKTPIPKEKNIIAEWISISGSPSSEVDLVDENNNVVLTVPPIINNNLAFSDNRSFTSIYKEFDLRLNNIPALANRYLNEQLNKKSNSVKKETLNNSDIAHRWQVILEKYDYVTPEPDITIEDIDDLDYD